MTTIIFLLAAFITTTNVAAQSCYHGEIRLVGGASPKEGRVEVCVNGVWGTVTHDGFYTYDARVVCRQLGYPVDDPGAYTRYRCCAVYGQGSGAIHLDSVSCSGTEASLLECSYRSPSSSSDSHSKDVGVICPVCDPDGAIRLSNGLSPQEGTVEICFSGIWRSVCYSYHWDDKDAFVVCRELGYPTTAARVFSNAYFGEHPRPNISNVLCYGNESKLLDCSYSNTSSCSPTNTAGVRCQGDTIPDPPCAESTVRLTGGEDQHEGRVEVCSNGVWGTICDGGHWDYNDTFVLCKQLGYQNPRVFVYRSSSFFGRGNGPIVFDDLTCDRTEPTLTQCSSSSPDQVYCSHYSDVGARCEEIATTVIDTCDDGDIRLMDGKSAAEGRVEICINNIWGSVCDDGWDTYDAGVVCNQLGFQSANATAFTGAYFGRSAGPYILDDVGCQGDELALLSCSHRGTFIHNCSPGEDAGIKCEVSSCLHGMVQLAGGATPYAGRLEFCNNGKWATVCGDNFGSVAALVVCKQLLGENASAIWSRSRRVFGQGTTISILDDVTCTGSESSISQCTYTEVRDFSAARCYHSDDVEMICYEMAGCTNFDVRLVDGDTGLEGRVEICVDGVWGAVSSYSFRYQAARVICNQLGYSSEWTIPLNGDIATSFFGRGQAPVLASDIYCSEAHVTLQDCSVVTYPLSNLLTYYSFFHRRATLSAVYGIICQGNATSETECIPGDAKLVGGSKVNEGRVEVCIDGFWGTVCEEGWDDEDASVICQQLGLSATANPALGFGEGRGPVISHLSCTSRESNISQCGWRIGTTDCHHGRDVAITCEDPQEHQVKLVISSPQAEGLFLIGTTATLQCLVDPPLPVLEEITYTWTTSASSVQPRSTNSSFPNATIVIPGGHPQESQYYCSVYRRQFLLGVGAGSIQVQNLLYALGSQFVQYTPAESITLNVSVASTSTDVSYNFRALTWFHNGMEVIPNERIVIMDFNKTLMISHTTDDDRGVYEVKFTGLFIHPYSKSCEQDILALLRHYPIAIPVHFYVYENTPESIVQDTTDTAVEFGFDENNQRITSENISLTVSGKVHASVDETVSTRWYFNGGGTLRPGTTIGPLQRPLLSIFQTIEIENAKNLDFGFYEVALTVNTRTHLLSHLECPSQYYSFVASTLRISDIVLARDVIQISKSDISNPVLPEPVEDGGQELFQIQVGPVEHCVSWNTEKATSLENAIQSAIISVIENYCDCTFPASNIIPGQFTCLMTTTQATYRSTISGTVGNNVTQLLATLQDWVASGPVIKLDWLLLHVSPGCPVHIASLQDPECSLSEPHTFDNPTLITSDYRVIKCVNVCLYRMQGHGICGAY